MSDRAVETEFVFGRHAATDLSVAYAILVPQRRARIVRAGQEGRPPRDERGDLRPGPGARQKKDQTIGSQTAALRAQPGSWGLTCRRSGSSRTRATPGRRWSVRPGSAARPGRPGVRGCGVVLLPGPARPQVRLPGTADRGVRPRRGAGGVRQGPAWRYPEDQLLVQFQGMFAEYEKAQLMERYRRGKAYRARLGSVNVLSGARSATGTSARATTPGPPTRSSNMRPCWSRRCSAATPTTAPRSPIWPAG